MPPGTDVGAATRARGPEWRRGGEDICRGMRRARMHAGGLGSAVSVHDVYRDVASTYHTMPLAPYDRFLCAFSHIFAGGYSAG